MKTVKNSKDITTLEVGDLVVFGDLEYVVNDNFRHNSTQYYLYCPTKYNGTIFEILNFRKKDFVEKLGIDADCFCDFPETKSLEALTAIVSALFKEYEKQKELPKTWEEFCKKNPIKEGECFVNHLSDIHISLKDNSRDVGFDKNICTSKQEAQAFLALMQLRQLRKAYVKDWEPDYKHPYYGIISNVHGFDILPYTLFHKSMSFPTEKLAKQFLTNFKDLLEIAKPLL